VFFWKDGSEVDCIINLKNKLVGFEVKWSEKPEAKKSFCGKIKRNLYFKQK
jgi:predicted AAA+ superfamily ATPase